METTQKSTNLRHCISCDFKCSKNIDWERHISTAKHQNRTNLNNLEQITPNYAKPLFVCKKCNKTYKEEQKTFHIGRLVQFVCLKYVTAFQFWEAFF